MNNDFGKGGRDTFIKEMTSRNIKVVADISTEAGQADFSADVVKIKAANADAIFVYLNEEESARFLKEAKKQGIKAPLIGETTLLGQKVIDLAGGAANGVKGHVGLTVDAPIPAVKEFAERFKKRFNYVCDHNGIKGYTGIYFIKYVTEKIGKFDSKLFAADRARHDHHAEAGTQHSDGSDLGQERRHRPRKLPGRSRGRQTEDRRDSAEARQITACLSVFRPAITAGRKPSASANGFLYSAFGIRPRDRGDLCPDRRRIYAAVADVADDQFRPGRIRHAAGVFHSGGDELRARRSGWPR